MHRLLVAIFPNSLIRFMFALYAMPRLKRDLDCLAMWREHILLGNLLDGSSTHYGVRAAFVSLGQGVVFCNMFRQVLRAFRMLPCGCNH